MKQHFFPEIPKEFRINVVNIRQIDEFVAMLEYLKIIYLRTEKEVVINSRKNDLTGKNYITNKLIETIFNHVTELNLKF